MFHRGCGGEIISDYNKMYDYEGQKIPALRCGECGVEILGDPDIEFEPGIEIYFGEDDRYGETNEKN